MKLGFDIVEYIVGRRAGLYTIRLHDPPDAETELDRFLTHQTHTANPDFDRLVRYLSTCPDKGFREGRPPTRARFRDEDRVLALSVAHPDGRLRYPPSLRLFCLRYMDVVILGSGGVKRERTLQAFRKRDVEVDRAYRIMQLAEHRLQKRLLIGDIQITGTRIEGDLSFYEDDVT